MQTSLYNHNTLGTQKKPLIPNLEFKLLVEKMNEGNLKAYEEAKEKWSFEAFQREFLNHKYLIIKEQNNGNE